MLRAGAGLDVGDRVELMPGYAPTTVNLYDIYYVVDDDRIVDVWPIDARYYVPAHGPGEGPSRPGRRHPGRVGRWSGGPEVG